MNILNSINMKKFISLIIACSCYAGAFSQDLNFSQFYELPLLRNPALCGVFNGDIRVQSVYRNQWQSVTVPYKTGGISLELKFPSANSYNYATIGLQATYDVAGDSRLSRLQLLPVGSYHVNLNGVEGAYLTGAVMAGIVSSQFDPSKLKWDDQYQNGGYSATNPTNQVIRNSNVNYFDQGVGLSVTSPFGNEASFYAGVGLYHFLKPSVAFNATNAATTKLNEKWVFNGGLKLPTSDWTRINLFADYLFQGGHRQLMAGAFYTTDIQQYDEEEDRTSISLGGALRMNDAFVPVVRLDHHKWSMGLSYDVNISKLKTASQSRGGFELTLNYKSFLNSRTVNAYKMNCPGL
jgi:type IX secretion system PorP/SprF family membrane protein